MVVSTKVHSKTTVEALPDRQLLFNQLCVEAAVCRLCPAMEGRRRLLSRENGPLDARVIFIGEAPGRHGGEQSGVPFSGDQAGRNFEQLLAIAGLSRTEIFITNAALCNPRDQQGRNRTPTTGEVANCNQLLARQLALIPAPFIVTLGAVALRALGRIAAHQCALRTAVGQVVCWQGRLLIPLYHPGSRAQLTRSFAQQSTDFAALGALIRTATSPD